MYFELIYKKSFLTFIHGSPKNIASLLYSKFFVKNLNIAVWRSLFLEFFAGIC